MHELRNRLSWKQKALWWAGLAAVSACLLTAPVLAKDPPPPHFIQFSIQGPDGKFFPQGEIEFCTPAGRCIYADIQEGFPGNFYLPSDQLQADTLYTVMIYDPQVRVLWEKRDWKFEPAKYDARWNRWLGTYKFLIYPRFFVHKDGSMTFEIETTLNPQWEKLMGLAEAYAGPDTLPDYPELLWATTAVVPLGGAFRADPDAAGGVDKVHVGFGLTGLRRYGYPIRELEADQWASFREIGFGYSQNLYDTDSVMRPGRSSDVTLHRFWLSLGYGRITQSMATHWSVSAAVGHARVYDGGEVLKYLDREYKMWGAGLQLRWARAFWSTDRASVGWFGQADYMYWSGGSLDNDHWYGGEPGLQLGVVVY